MFNVSLVTTKQLESNRQDFKNPVSSNKENQSTEGTEWSGTSNVLSLVSKKNCIHRTFFCQNNRHFKHILN